MYDRDDILQEKLLDLENGIPLEQILANVPAAEKEITELIQLAAQVRSMPHPKPRLAQKHKQRPILTQNTTYAPGANGNGHRSYKDQKSSINTTKLPGFTRQFVHWHKLGLITATVFVGVLLIMAFIGSAFLYGGLWQVNSSDAQSASLENVTGIVEMASTTAGTDWHPLAVGNKIQSGQRLRTGSNSSATLVFFDGSRASLGSGADITFNRVDGDRDNVLRVVMTQNAGKSKHEVVPFTGKNSTYLVFTPSGTVSVHGTQFSVDVGDSGKTRFAVDTGKVLIANYASQVYLTAGKTLLALPQETLDTPDYQFSLQGTLTANAGNTWTVAKVSFEVNENTIPSGNPKLNDPVLIEGHLLEDGTWVADSIIKLEEGSELRSFSGALFKMDGKEWQVDNHHFLVDTNTMMDEDLMLGAVVQVIFTLLPDGQWLALNIGLQGEEPRKPAPISVLDPEAHPVLVFDPAELAIPVCSGDVNFRAALRNDGLEEGDNAVAVVLDYAILSGGEYVDSVSINPDLIHLIRAGEHENLTGEVDLADTWEAVTDGTSLELRVFIASEGNTPGGHLASLNLTFVKGCANEETPTATLTNTLPISETLTATPILTNTLTWTPEPTQTPETDCTGANPHPKARDLAQEYGVPYEEIMNWFCQNYGFGEIDQAYGLSQQYSVPVANIFALRASGMGWGLIKKALANGQLPAETPSAIPVSPDVTETPIPPAAPDTPKPTKVSNDKDDGDACSSSGSQHPSGKKLAQKYGVSYNEIIDWYCQGFGFGEIGHGYSLSQEFNTPVADIFDMRSSGMGWGQIKNALANGN